MNLKRRNIERFMGWEYDTSPYTPGYHVDGKSYTTLKSASPLVVKKLISKGVKFKAYNMTNGPMFESYKRKVNMSYDIVDLLDKTIRDLDV